jgi:SAM-dependent MidA family methyltransferase
VLRRRLLDRIAREGPLPFDEFMRACLYDPDGGFFGSGPLRSHREGDFLTSPEVSPLFGETLGRFVSAELERFSGPGCIVEAGAGSGSLLGPLVASLAAPVPVWAIEVSPGAREHLASVVPSARVVSAMEEIPGPIDGLVLANELLDNLPAAIVVRRGDGWAEQVVARSGDELTREERPAREAVAAWADRHAGPVPEGGVVEVQLGAAAWLRSALGLLRAGAVVVIDYGDTAAGLAGRRAEGTLRTYRGHHLGPDPLLEPGATDITMDVDFGALQEVAREAGAAVEYLRQVEFLEQWGLRDRIGGLREEELRLARSGPALERLRVKSEITDGETLLHPRGLGDFRVLVARI